jgi:hypothetical protein
MQTPIQQIKTFKDMSHEERVAMYPLAQKFALHLLKTFAFVIVYIILILGIGYFLFSIVSIINILIQ